MYGEKIMSRDINYLLNKYQTKQPGEKWPTNWEKEAKRNYRFKERIFLFDKINNNRFLKGGQKTRAEYIIKHFDFNIMGNVNDEDTIRMIMLYVKIEYTQKHISDYDYYLKNHNISKNRFITFLINLNKQSINSKFV